jgi:pyrroline-5-carboxylate reductase
MIDARLLVIGGGQMGRALVGGMLAGEVIESDRVTVADPNVDARAWWRSHLPSVTVVDRFAEAVDDAEVVLLAVKPNVILEVARQSEEGWNDRLMISIAAGVALDQLIDAIGHRRVTRVMPNTPGLVGAGASAYCCGDGVDGDDRKVIEAMLGAIGLVVPVDEHQMDAVTGLSGSGPAYVYVAIEALADGGVQAGLPRPLALKLAVQTVLGAAKMVAETERHPAELKDAVASPGGTTIAGLRALEQNGLRSALIEAVTAAAERSRQLGRG